MTCTVCHGWGSVTMGGHMAGRTVVAVFPCPEGCKLLLPTAMAPMAHVGSTAPVRTMWDDPESDAPPPPPLTPVRFERHAMHREGLQARPAVDDLTPEQVQRSVNELVDAFTEHQDTVRLGLDVLRLIAAAGGTAWEISRWIR